MSRKSIVVVALLLAIAAGAGGIVHRVSNARGVSEIVIEAPGWRIQLPEGRERSDTVRFFFSPRTPISTPIDQLPPATAEYLEVDLWTIALVPTATEIEVGPQSALMSMQDETQTTVGAASWRGRDGRKHRGVIVLSALLAGDPSRSGIVVALVPESSEPGDVSVSDVRVDSEFVKGWRRALTGAAGRFTVTVPPPRATGP